MLCPACGVEQLPGSRFCEDCGSRLGDAPVVVTQAPAVCPQCGAADAVDADGFCTRCGFERVRPARDHLEVSAAPHLAGVSDRGRRHPHNEDFFVLAATSDSDVAVVCDGVSSSQNAADAARVASEAACAALQQGRAVNESSETLFHKAFRDAQDAVAALPWTKALKTDPPETTMVAALRHGRHVTVGWVGDSRAYLIVPGGARLLTHDHSWVNEIVAAGRMTVAEAERAPKAHCLTRTLGGPEVDTEGPSLVRLDLPPGPGWLLLCSDGLWNCVPAAERIADLVRLLPAGDALAVARALVKFACDRSGHDNITAAVLAFGEPFSAVASGVA